MLVRSTRHKSAISLAGRTVGGNDGGAQRAAKKSTEVKWQRRRWREEQSYKVAKGMKTMLLFFTKKLKRGVCFSSLSKKL